MIARSSAVLYLLVAAAGASSQQVRTQKPDIVLIISDDLGYGDLSSYGAPDAKTPNIDLLAKRGVRFTDSYASGATCSATRAALMTGRYQQRIGLEWALGPAGNPVDTVPGLPVTDASYPKLLKAQGYSTALIGKWHLGETKPVRPRSHGFDYFWGFLGGADDYYSHRDMFNREDLYENETPVHVPDYLTDAITQHALRFIGDHASEPFFIEVAYNATHWPFEPPGDSAAAKRNSPAHWDTPSDSSPRSRADYIKMLERMDRGVGEILRLLDARGLTHNTLVIFTNDNGGEWLSRNAPFFHRKGTLWEGGIRVPLILSWPARLPAGRVSRQPAITMDATTTVLAAGGAVPAPGLPLDGLDLLPIAAGKKAVVERDLFWRINIPGRIEHAVRSGPWKLIVQGENARDGMHQLLFNLDTDPNEHHDLAAQNTARVRELRMRIATWEQDVHESRYGRDVAASIMALAKTVPVDSVIAVYRSYKSAPPRTYDVNEGVLNGLGYWYLANSRPADAVKVLQLNAAEYPASWNTHDSLAEAQLALGDTARAIENYRHSIRLNPNNANAVATLERLGVSPH